MDTDTTTQQKPIKRQLRMRAQQPANLGSGLVPPPPAAAVNPQLFMAPPISTPGYAIPQQPQAPPTPQVMPVVQQSQTLIDPDQMSNLNAGVESARQSAVAARAKANSGAFMSDVNIAPQSPEEVNLENELRGRMVKLLADKDSPGDRFGKGFDMGQKIAANLIVPLLGLRKGAGLGGQLGYAQAAQNMTQQANQEMAQRRQERAQRNAAIAQIAGMYENMNPNSIKNLTALAQLKLSALQRNQTAQNELDTQALNAEKAYYDAQAKAAGYQSKGAIAGAKTAETTRHNQASENVADRNATTKEGELDETINRDKNTKATADANLSQRKVEEKGRNSRLDKTNGVKGTQQRGEALAKAGSLVKSAQSIMTKRSLGLPSNPGFDPSATYENARQILKEANFTDDEIKKIVPDNPVQTPPEKSEDDDNPIKTLQGIFSKVGEATKAPDIAPVKGKSEAAPSLDEHDSFVKKYGRPPKNAQELVDFANGKG